MSRRAIISVLTFASFILLVLIVLLLASGYWYDRQTGQLQGTGILVLESEPTGANITINGQPKGASNTTISNLEPGTYDVTYSRDGYFDWQKEVSIVKGKVTTIVALMIPINPSLAPITSTPAEQTVLSPDSQRLAYVVKNGTSSGVWVLDLSAQPFNISRKPIHVLPDTEAIKYSLGTLKWSPQGKELLVSLEDAGLDVSYVVNTDNPSNPVAVNAAELQQQWTEDRRELNQQLGADLEEEAKQLIADHNDTVVWSPDNLKFLYQVDEDGQQTTYVYNKESKATSQAYTPKDNFSVVRWFADSNHLLLLEKDSREATTGTVKLMGMDGSNKQQIYSGTLAGDALYAYLSGSKLIILTSFNQQEPVYYLYSINLR